MKIGDKEIPLRRISDLLCSALEGGSNYWYWINKFVQPPVVRFRSDEKTLYKHLDYPLNEGGELVFKKNKDATFVTDRLNLRTIEAGLKCMAEKYPKHFAAFLEEIDDADTGDVFLQCCLLGELVYG